MYIYIRSEIYFKKLLTGSERLADSVLLEKLEAGVPERASHSSVPADLLLASGTMVFVLCRSLTNCMVFTTL